MQGFEVEFQDGGHALLKRGRAALRLIQVAEGVNLKHPQREASFYVDVIGVDALYNSLESALDALSHDRVRAPFDRPYGQREFYVWDEDCTLVFLGEAIGVKPNKKPRQGHARARLFTF